jgi:hypothetical protein
MIELDKLNSWIESNIQSMVSNTNDWKLGTNNSQAVKAVSNSLNKSGVKGSYRFNYHGLMLPFE